MCAVGEVDIEVAAGPASFDDLEDVVELLNLCSFDTRGIRDFAVEEIRADWRINGFDLAADTMTLRAADRRLVGYADLWWKSATFTRFTAWVCVHPEFRGHGMGTFLNRWVETRARALIPRAEPGIRVVVRSRIYENEKAARDLLTDLGFRDARYSWSMEISFEVAPPAPIWPRGITIRPMGEGEERKVYDARCAAFRDHWGWIEEPDKEDYAKWLHISTTNPHYDPSLWFIVEEGKRVVGFAVCTARTVEDGGKGWIELLGVDPAYRRRGLGEAILLHCFGAFYRRGRRKVGLSVDAQSLTGATRLYERAGMTTIENWVIYEKELRAGQEISRQSL